MQGLQLPHQAVHQSQLGDRQAQLNASQNPYAAMMVGYPAIAGQFSMPHHVLPSAPMPGPPHTQATYINQMAQGYAPMAHMYGQNTSPRHSESTHSPAAPQYHSLNHGATGPSQPSAMTSPTQAVGAMSLAPGNVPVMRHAPHSGTGLVTDSRSTAAAQPASAPAPAPVPAPAPNSVRKSVPTPVVVQVMAAPGPAPSSTGAPTSAADETLPKAGSTADPKPTASKDTPNKDANPDFVKRDFFICQPLKGNMPSVKNDVFVGYPPAERLSDIVESYLGTVVKFSKRKGNLDERVEGHKSKLLAQLRRRVGPKIELSNAEMDLMRTEIALSQAELELADAKAKHMFNAMCNLTPRVNALRKQQLELEEQIGEPGPEPHSMLFNTAMFVPEINKRRWPDVDVIRRARVEPAKKAYKPFKPKGSAAKWVQCSNMYCRKWRRRPGGEGDDDQNGGKNGDTSTSSSTDSGSASANGKKANKAIVVPKVFTCVMNNWDTRYASCSAPQEYTRHDLTFRYSQLSVLDPVFVPKAKERPMNHTDELFASFAPRNSVGRAPAGAASSGRKSSKGKGSRRNSSKQKGAQKGARAKPSQQSSKNGGKKPAKKRKRASSSKTSDAAKAGSKGKSSAKANGKTAGSKSTTSSGVQAPKSNDPSVKASSVSKPVPKPAKRKSSASRSDASSSKKPATIVGRAGVPLKQNAGGGRGKSPSYTRVGVSVTRK